MPHLVEDGRKGGKVSQQVSWKSCVVTSNVAKVIFGGTLFTKDCLRLP